MVELILESYVTRLDLVRIFGRAGPLHVDLGCGDGTFLSSLAARMPQKNFLGIERLAGRVNSAARKAAKIDNVRVLRAETSYAVQYLLPPQSVEAFYLLFPDPWPKRRHQRRRVVTKDFLDAAGDALARNGILRIATDQRDYFEQIERLAEQSSHFVATQLGESEELPETKFEKLFKQKGAEIYRLELRKISPVI